MRSYVTTVFNPQRSSDGIRGRHYWSIRLHTEVSITSAETYTSRIAVDLEWEFDSAEAADEAAAEIAAKLGWDTNPWVDATGADPYTGE